MYEYSKVELDSIVKFLDAIIVIDPIYSESIRPVIKKTMNRNYNDETIDKIIQDTQNIRDSLYLLDKHVNDYIEFVCRKIEMFNYNYLKNNDETITMINPDPASESELLHIYDSKKCSFTRCGPDVKFGSADYIVDVYIEKYLMNEESHDFIDITGYMKAEDYCEKNGFRTLNKRQNAKVLDAIRKYGYKPTITSGISRMEFHRVIYYYLNYLVSGIIPSKIEISDLSDLANSINRNELTENQIRKNICVDQALLMVSDIYILKDEMENANEDHTTKSEESIQTNSMDKSLITRNDTTNGKLPLQKKPMSKKVLKVLIGMGIVIVVAGGVAGGVLLARSLKFRNKDVKFLKDLPIPMIKGKVNINTSENIANIVPIAEDIFEAANKIAKHINADNISSFREAFDMFKNGQITKAEFFEITKLVSSKTGKNPLKYLQLLVNFFGDKNAATLLEI